MLGHETDRITHIDADSCHVSYHGGEGKPSVNPVGRDGAPKGQAHMHMGKCRQPGKLHNLLAGQESYHRIRRGRELVGRAPGMRPRRSV